MQCVHRTLRILVCLASFLCCPAAAGDDADWNAAYEKRFLACTEGRYQEARDTLETALQKWQFPDRDPRRVSAIEVLATATGRLGDFTAAAALHLDVLSNADETTVTGNRLRALAFNNLGEIRVEQGRWDEAASLLEQALVLYRRTVGENSPLTAFSMENLGTLYLIRGDLGKAGLLLEQAVRILRQTTPERRAGLASNLSKLGWVYAQSAQYSIAMPLLEEAVSAGTPLGEHEPVLADALVRLASVFLDQGMMARAEPLLRKAISIYEKNGDINRMRGASALSKFGVLRFHERNYPAAVLYYRQALDILRKAFGPDHISIAATEVNLALALLHLEKYEASDTLLRHSYAIEKTAYGDSRPLARWLCVRAQLEAKLKHKVEAEARFREGIAMFEKTAGPAHPSTAEALMTYADFLQTARKKEAASLRRRAAAILSEQPATSFFVH